MQTTQYVTTGDQDDLLSNGIDNIDVTIMKERRRDIIQIERDTRDVAEIMQDLSILVSEQGEQLDVADTHIDSTVQATTEAVEALALAKRWQARARGIIVDASVVMGGVGFGALGFLATPMVGIPTLVGGILVSAAVVTIRRSAAK